MVDSFNGDKEVNIHYTDLSDLNRRYSSAKGKLLSSEGMYSSYQDKDLFYRVQNDGGEPLEPSQIQNFLKSASDLLDKQVMVATHDKSKLKEWGTNINDLLVTRDCYKLAFQETLSPSERPVSYKHEESVDALHAVFGLLAYEVSEKMLSIDRKYKLKHHPAGVRTSPISYILAKLYGENLDSVASRRVGMMDDVYRATRVRNFVINTWPK